MTNATITEIATGNRALTYLPVGSLRRFGLTPDGGNLYRVVFSTSRLHMLGGTWPDGVTEYRWVPRYPMPMWCLEKWLSADDYAGPESDWKKDATTGLYTLGPYPKDGEYEFCFGWPVDMEPSITQVEDVITYLEYRRRNFNTSHYLADEQERQAYHQRKWEERNTLMMQDAIKSQFIRPTERNPNPPRLTANDMKFDYTAEQLGLGKGGIMPKEKVQ